MQEVVIAAYLGKICGIILAVYVFPLLLSKITVKAFKWSVLKSRFWGVLIFSTYSILLPTISSVYRGELNDASFVNTIGESVILIIISAGIMGFFVFGFTFRNIYFLLLIVLLSLPLNFMFNLLMNFYKQYSLSDSAINQIVGQYVLYFSYATSSFLVYRNKIPFLYLSDQKNSKPEPKKKMSLGEMMVDAQKNPQNYDRSNFPD